MKTAKTQNRYTTKNGKQFTRFAIKGILTNPVYLIADADAYEYLTQKNVDLFSDRSDFDGFHGIMAYNRTLQIRKKSNQIKPMEEWIVSVGKHPGIIEGKDWVKVQSILDQNKAKSYRKPRSNVALLSGLLICGNCGEYMRPKLSQRLNTKGELIYTYVCNMKERSRSHVCSMKNCNGNILDASIIEQIKELSEDGSEFIEQLENSKRVLMGNRENYDEEIKALEAEISANDDEIKGLVTALGKAAGTPTEDYILQQISELHDKGDGLKRHLSELKELVSSHALADIEFDLLSQILSTFRDTVDEMSVVQKRAAIRTFVKEIIWDGKDAHVVLFGSDYEYEFPETPVGISKLSSENEGKINFDKTAERGDVEPLGEYSVFDAARGIRRQPHAAVRTVCGHAFDQPDRSDRDKILRIGRRRVILFDDVHHKTQIVLDQSIAGLHIPAQHPPDARLLFGRLQRSGKGGHIIPKTEYYQRAGQQQHK